MAEATHQRSSGRRQQTATAEKQFDDETVEQLKVLPKEMERITKSMDSIRRTISDLRTTLDQTERQTEPKVIERDVEEGVRKTLQETRSTLAQKARGAVFSLVPHSRRDTGMLVEGLMVGSALTIQMISRDWFGAGDLVTTPIV